jgi:glycosyltransferase domain-containing protein
MSLRDQLTVIVPIRDRRSYLPRVMNYYRDSPCDVIFLDSTEDEAYKDTDPTPNKYIHVPGKNYCEKLHDCLSSIKTKYSVVICDDDFLMFDSLEQCISKINEINDDIISFRGQSVALHEQFLSIETLDYFIELDLQPRVEHKERIERAWRFFNGSIVHNVMLTKVQVAIHKFVLDNPQYNAINYFDKMFAILAAHYGNNITLPTFYMLKSSEGFNSSIKKREKVKDTWKKDLSFSKDFLKSDLKTLCDFLNITKEELEKLHENLILQTFRTDACYKVLELNVLPEELHVSIYAPFTYFNHCQFGYRCIAGRLSNRDLLIRIGLGGSLDGRNDFVHRFVFSKNRPSMSKELFSAMYPTLHSQNLEQIKKVLSYVDKFKRTDETSVPVMMQKENLYP